MQRGQIYKHRSSWILRYYDDVDGKRKRVAKVLVPVSRDYPTATSVKPLADAILAPLNLGHQVSLSSTRVTEFIEKFYLPWVFKNKKPSTHLDYTSVFRAHIQKRLGDLRLKDFRTMHAQRILREIPDIGHTTRLRIKSFLSGAFKHALQEGFLDGHNPVRDASAPGKPVKFIGETYTLAEIAKISEVLKKTNQVAYAAVSIAAFAGLRHAELRGLQWKDYDGKCLWIRRTLWRTHVGDTKNTASSAAVPVIPALHAILHEHWIRCGGQDWMYILPGEHQATSMNLANLARRVIMPALKAANLEWKGWHAFRRSLATNLYAIGTSPKVIQAILRHSDISTTLAYYVMPDESESRAALQKLNALGTIDEAPG